MVTTVLAVAVWLGRCSPQLFMGTPRNFHLEQWSVGGQCKYLCSHFFILARLTLEPNKEGFNVVAFSFTFYTSLNTSARKYCKLYEVDFTPIFHCDFLLAVEDLRFSRRLTMKNGVLWDVMPCGPCNNRRFGGT
jgi:hypothetical protein